MGYGISYNRRYSNEVKIHAGSCRFTRNASQAGEVKWKFSEDLGNSVLIANDLCTHSNQWRYAQCCLRNASYIYKCRKCDSEFSSELDYTEVDCPGCNSKEVSQI